MILESVLMAFNSTLISLVLRNDAIFSLDLLIDVQKALMKYFFLLK